MVHKLLSPLPLALAETIVDAALAHGRKHGMEPLAIVVLDLGGHVILAKREDGAGIMRLEVATAKAWGALGMGVAPKGFGEKLSGNPNFVTALVAASDGRFAPHAGGVLILDDNGHGIGAVGISGDLGNNDETCALAGLAAAGLKFSA